MVKDLGSELGLAWETAVRHTFDTAGGVSVGVSPFDPAANKLSNEVEATPEFKPAEFDPMG